MELCVVLDQPIVHVDDIATNIASSAVAIECHYLWIRRRGRVFGYYSLFQIELDRIRRDPPDSCAHGVRHPDAIGAHLRFESPRFHLVDHVVASSRLRWSAGHVWLERQKSGVS